MQKMGGQRQYLVINLTTEQWEVQLIPQPTFEKYLGGEALGLHLWSLHTNTSTEASPLCFVCGALTGSSIPCTNSLSIVGLSKATNLIESATNLTEFAGMLVSCGWQAVIIKGIARRPMVLHINSHSVEFKPCERLLGKLIHETEQALATEAPSSILSIGPAGENGVVYASIFHGEKPLDRCGFGALLGQKQIKAIVVTSGAVEYSPIDPTGFQSTRKTFSQIIEKSSYIKNYGSSGELALISKAMQQGFAGIENITKRYDPRLYHLDGEELERLFSLEIATCKECPMDCRKLVMRPGGHDLVVPDLLEMMALGSNLGNYDVLIAMQWRQKCVELGLHPVDTGLVIGWIMAAREQEFVDFSTTVTFGETVGVEQLIEMIAKGIGEGAMYGKGSAHLEKLYLTVGQAEKISCHINGREMIPIDPRGAWGEALLMALNEDFLFIPELLFPFLPLESSTKKAEWVVVQENLLALFRSVGVCPRLLIPLVFESNHQLQKLILRTPLGAWLALDTKVLEDLVDEFLGIGLTKKQLLDIARRSLLLQRTINNNSAQPPFAIPLRFILDPASNHPSSAVVPYRQLVDRYEFLRALDLASTGE
ncbi:MAG: aldehyde ferredoxin oxidoreductase N-terminal domain-containing protein [Sphaerochaetaceae bacterium]|jgi:aldehyde:ferredoxin oxidoreductase|nr:aldehyde ferredoxin oxidoreductase N-terminal domain-containing protein [Sphaerochaetaceae bacterium]MDD3367060.1 aldehyde ferredoxin oxidoreductase N-terminal domain-containing protein [Sphaerochaetaceae bacterium]MDD4219459.1 aldehyde ferredoxin oxidoreductase N-terminal domain-containing protein [Sphaerochaetaceae bacterium]MDY0371048.1 aldehyde ferredoxin oxidoreductase N-terminal domain-containing protein [Sphaerochaetaceae bacterium]